MKMVEARSVVSAAAVGCMTGGKLAHCATMPKNQRVGCVSNPTGECSKCDISTAEVRAKNVDSPRQSGKLTRAAINSVMHIRQQKPHKLRVTLCSDLTRNQKNKGAINKAMKFMLIAKPRMTMTASSRQRPLFCTYNHVARRKRVISTPSLCPLPANSNSISGFQA